MIKDWIETEYTPRNNEETKEALRQVMQQITLAGLYKAGFFEKAAFYGGTALRIFYGLPRYSEDLDFSLYETQPDFSIDRYLRTVQNEFQALGINVQIKTKNKTVKTDIHSAFLKTETLVRDILLESDDFRFTEKERVGVKIKIEVDVDPPLGFETEHKLLLRPFSCYITCFSSDNLMAGKVHALLFRRWKNRVKGRDWYDFEWYIKKGVPVNLNHLKNRSVQSKDFDDNEPMTYNRLLDLLSERIRQVDFEQAKADVIRFVKSTDELQIWSQQYFLDLIKNLKVK